MEKGLRKRSKNKQECSLLHLGDDYLIQHGYLFKGTRFCIPKYGIRELLVREVYEGPVVGHFVKKQDLYHVKGTLLFAWYE